MALCAVAEDKGRCPSPADAAKAARAKPTPIPEQTPPTSDPKYAGVVSLRLVISDKGYVCSVQLVRGFDKTADAKAIQIARNRRFTPGHLKNGTPVAVDMLVEVAFIRKENGELIPESPGKPVK